MQTYILVQTPCCDERVDVDSHHRTLVQPRSTIIAMLGTFDQDGNFYGARRPWSLLEEMMVKSIYITTCYRIPSP